MSDPLSDFLVGADSHSLAPDQSDVSGMESGLDLFRNVSVKLTVRMPFMLRISLFSVILLRTPLVSMISLPTLLVSAISSRTLSVRVFQLTSQTVVYLQEKFFKNADVLC